MNWIARLICLTSRLARLEAAVNSRISDTIVEVSDDYVVQLTDSTIVANTSDGPVTLTLPDAAAAKGMRKTFKRIPGGGDDVTILPVGSDTIDGAADFVLGNDWSSVSFRATDGLWLITAAYNT